MPCTGRFSGYKVHVVAGVHAAITSVDLSRQGLQRLHLPERHVLLQPVADGQTLPRALRHFTLCAMEVVLHELLNQTDIEFSLVL